MMPRHDLLLHQLPYMAIIRRHDPESWQLDKITSIRANARLRDDGMEDVEEPPRQWRSKQPSSSAFGPQLPREEEKLFLSDDDIVD
jgi:cell cycle checkpoint protein